MNAAAATRALVRSVGGKVTRSLPLAGPQLRAA